MVPKKLVFMTPDWKDAFNYATDVARANQLEMAIAGSPGWSVMGGPWVTAPDAMKKYVWSEMLLTGGQPFTGKLPMPPATTGSFQQVPIAEQEITRGTTQTLPTYYQDAALIAYRLPVDDRPFTQLTPKVSSSGGTFNLKAVTDGDVNKATYLPPTAVGEAMWIQYEFDKPQTFRAFSIAGANHTALEQFNGGPENRALSVSDDGVTFRTVVTIPGSIVPQNTRLIPPTTARFFRFTFTTLKPEVNMFAAMAGRTETPKPEGVNVAELRLYGTDRIDLFEDKAGFMPWVETPPGTESAVAGAIPLTDVIDLSKQLKADGTLNWTPPYGTWQLVRLCYSLTGRQNHPASPEATGLEVNKFDKDAVRRYINTYLDMYNDVTGRKLGASGLQYMILDSYEARHMNWTKALPDEFRKRRGHSLTP